MARALLDPGNGSVRGYLQNRLSEIVDLGVERNGFEFLFAEIKRQQSELDILVGTLSREARFYANTTDISEKVSRMKIFATQSLFPSIEGDRHPIGNHTSKPRGTISLQ